MNLKTGFNISHVPLMYHFIFAKIPINTKILKLTLVNNENIIGGLAQLGERYAGSVEVRSSFLVYYCAYYS